MVCLFFLGLSLPSVYRAGFTLQVGSSQGVAKRHYCTPNQQLSSFPSGSTYWYLGVYASILQIVERTIEVLARLERQMTLHQIWTCELSYLLFLSVICFSVIPLHNRFERKVMVLFCSERMSKGMPGYGFSLSSFWINIGERKTLIPVPASYTSLNETWNQGKSQMEGSLTYCHVC